MEVEVKMGDPLWKTVGQRGIMVELKDGATVADALAHLTAVYPGFGAALEAGGTRLGVPFNFFVNRKLVKDGDLDRHRLRTGDRLHILAPIVGGQVKVAPGGKHEPSDP
jgi:sulfur carrier protein ThiS